MFEAIDGYKEYSESLKRLYKNKRKVQDKEEKLNIEDEITELKADFNKRIKTYIQSISGDFYKKHSEDLGISSFVDKKGHTISLLIVLLK